MALQINTGLTTTDGGSVDFGSYVIFSTSFPARGLNYSVEIYIYRSLAALDNGLSSLKVIEIPQYFYTKELTEEEYADLTPITIHNDVKTFLEQYVGVGNVDVIL
jgi:hypothetical protein